MIGAAGIPRWSTSNNMKREFRPRHRSQVDFLGLRLSVEARVRRRNDSHPSVFKRTSRKPGALLNPRDEHRWRTYRVVSKCEIRWGFKTKNMKHSEEYPHKVNRSHCYDFPPQGASCAVRPWVCTCHPLVGRRGCWFRQIIAGYAGTSASRMKVLLSFNTLIALVHSLKPG